MIGVSVLTCVTMIAAPVPEELRPGLGAWVEYKPAPGETPEEIRRNLERLAKEIRDSGGVFFALIMNKNKLEVLKGKSGADQFWFRDQVELRVQLDKKRVEIWFSQGSREDRLALSNAIAQHYERNDLNRALGNAKSSLRSSVSSKDINKERIARCEISIKFNEWNGTLEKVPEMIQERDRLMGREEELEQEVQRWEAESERLSRIKIYLRN